MIFPTLPASWQEVTIEDIQSELGSGVTPRGGESSYLPSGVPLIRSQNVLMNQLSLEDVAYISLATHQAMKRSAVAPGDVLLNITGASIGRIAWVPEDLSTANVNQHVCRIRLKPEACPPFVSLFFSSEGGQAQIMGSQFGTTRQGLNYGQVRALKVPLPPLPEQRAIARALCSVQVAKEARQREVELERERKAALMQHLFTRGTRSEPLKQTQAGEVPESWEVFRFAQLIASGPQNGLYKPASEYGEGVPILRIDAFEGGHTISSQALKRLRLTREERERYRLNRGDIVLNRVNGSIEIVGKCALIGDLHEPTVFESNMMRLAVDTRRTSPEYALVFLCSAFAREQIRRKARVINQASINQQDLGSILIPLPGRKEQEQIVAVLKACEARATALKWESSLLDELFRGLLEELMTGRLSAGELMDPADGGDQ
jgi:type I restriction enzyme, S subunit